MRAFLDHVLSIKARAQWGAERARLTLDEWDVNTRGSRPDGELKGSWCAIVAM
jgi:hypothetical protein